MDNTFNVYVRVRPPTEREINQNSEKSRQIVEIEGNKISVLEGLISYSKEKTYCFDGIFCENDSNQKVYEQAMRSLVESAQNSFNATVFAYGMTGAGKTYTVLGHQSKQIPGITELSVCDLLKVSDTLCTLSLSYLEIYNEQVRDLLVTNNQLLIVEDPLKGVQVPELSEMNIEDASQLYKWIELGNSRRIMAPTSINQVSSRSHAIIQLNITQRTTDLNQTCSKMSFVDLAGSERAATSQNKGVRMLESAKINRSLLALGNCINILGDKSKSGCFVPYRDSKLTRLLKDSLGGNTLTVMLACISPVALCHDETLNTLKYASRATQIKRHVKKNIQVKGHFSEFKIIIEGLKEEIQTLKAQLAFYQKNQTPTVEIVKRGNAKEKKRKKEENKNLKQLIEQTSQQLLDNIEEC